MLALLTAVHILIAIVLILIILLQSSQGADIASAFGGMGGQTAFGPRGTTNFLSKSTVVLAALFMVTSVTLSIIGSRGGSSGGSVLSGEPTSVPPAGQPAAGATPAPTVPAVSMPAGAPAVQVGTDGLQGIKANVTVENAGEAPNPNTPAATVQGGSATPPAATPAGAAQPSKPATPAPYGQ